jgi:hypothetical protein
VSAGERRHDRGLVAGHTVGEQRQHVGRDPLDHGIEIVGGGGAGRFGGGHAGHDTGPGRLAKSPGAQQSRGTARHIKADRLRQDH